MKLIKDILQLTYNCIFVPFYYIKVIITIRIYLFFKMVFVIVDYGNLCFYALLIRCLRQRARDKPALPASFLHWF